MILEVTRDINDIVLCHKLPSVMLSMAYNWVEVTSTGRKATGWSKAVVMIING